MVEEGYARRLSLDTGVAEASFTVTTLDGSGQGVEVEGKLRKTEYGRQVFSSAVDDVLWARSWCKVYGSKSTPQLTDSKSRLDAPWTPYPEGTGCLDVTVTLERPPDNIGVMVEMRNLTLAGQPASAQSHEQKGMGWRLEGAQQVLQWGHISLVQTAAYSGLPRPGVAGIPNMGFKGLGYHACVAVVPSINAFGWHKAPEAGQRQPAPGREDAPSSAEFSQDGTAVHVKGAHAIDIIVAGATRFLRGNHSATHLLPVEEAERRCVESLENALRRGFTAVEAAHTSEHREKMQRTSITAHSAHPNNASSDACAATLTTPERVARYARTCFPQGNTSTPIPVKDVSLQTLFFALGKYLLLGSSRTGTQPANLVGIWAEGIESPWNGDYHININLQMMYWAAESLQLTESAEPLVAFTHELARSGVSTASCMYGMPGWVAHGFTDIWMKTRALGDPQWAMCVTCGAWVSLHLLDAFRFREDRTALIQDILPILAGAVEFFLSYLTPHGPDGSLLTGPTHSPENSYQLGGKYWPLGMSPAIDTAILYELFSGYVDACTAVQVSCTGGGVSCDGTRCHELAERAQKTLARLPNKGFPIVSDTGHIEEYLRWGLTAEHTIPDWGHRHWSPLFSLFPGNQIHRHEAPQLAAAAEATVRRKMDAGGAHTGWSAAWAGALYARLGDSGGVQRMLDRLLGRFAMGNLLSTHPPLQSSVNDCSTCVNEVPLPVDERYWGEKGGGTENFVATDNSKFQLDGNLGALALITEAILQSRDRKCTCTKTPVAWAQASAYTPPSLNASFHPASMPPFASSSGGAAATRSQRIDDLGPQSPGGEGEKIVSAFEKALVIETEKERERIAQFVKERERVLELSMQKEKEKERARARKKSERASSRAEGSSLQNFTLLSSAASTTVANIPHPGTNPQMSAT